jgi:class 3 adenylate cyclase/tetratricopeptide (TPR) repeat protein
MRCLGCNAENLAGAKFCDSCGILLPHACPSCGEPNRPTAKFCHACGAALQSETGATASRAPSNPPSRQHSAYAVTQAVEPQFVPEGERKLVTALFVDIIGSTEIGQDLDPEETRAIIDPALELMINAARHFDGYVVQSTGDGIFALFGAPVAREDHAQCALYAAIKMRQDLARYSRQLTAEGQRPLEFRAGANTGEVVVRSIKTGDSHIEYTPIGHTVNLASRLQGLAQPGATVISDSTRSLVEGFFALRSLGPSTVKGVNEPLNVHEVTGLGPLRTRLERAAGRGLSRFVGRTKEKDALARAADLAKSGMGQIVAVMAEPGVGKSRLFFEFKTKLQSEWKVIEAFSVAHGRGSAYLPVVELLRDYFGITGDDKAPERREKIAATALSLDPSLQDGLPYLNALLEVTEDKERLAGMEPRLRKTRTLEAVSRLLLAESAKQPLAIVFEDLHWIDEESQALLDLLADAISEARVLMLVNYRPEYTPRWNDKAWCTRLRLESLGGDNAEELLSALLADDHALSPLKELIIETTGGVPFFMEETIQALFDEGALERRKGKVHLMRPLDSLRIPPTVQAILAARIDRLQTDEKNLLQTLAVLGREFVLSLARAVAGKSEQELERLIAQLERGDFVYEQPSMTDVEYIFKHALTQEVAYNSVLLERRKQLHEHVGRAIEMLYSTSLDDHLAELAHHFSRSVNQVKAIEYLHLAGSQAMSRGALVQAIRDFEAALDLIKSLPPGTKRDALELTQLSPLGTAYIAIRGYASPEIGPVFSRARELCERIGTPEQLFAVVWGNFAWHVVRGEMGLSLDIAKESMALAERFDDPGIWMEALFLVGVTQFYRGDFVEALTHYERGLSRYDNRERTRLWAMRVGEDAGVTHRCYTALALWHLGYPEQSLRAITETKRLAREIEHPFSLAYAQHHTTWLYHRLGLPTEMLASSDEGLQTATEHGFALFHATATIYRAAALLLGRRPLEALPHITNGLEAYRRTGAGMALPYYLSILADACMQLGRFDEASAALEEAIEIAHTNEELCQIPELHRLRGELFMLADSRFEDAEAEFHTAIEKAQHQSSKAWMLRASTSLADLFSKTGRARDGQRILHAAYENFTEGFNTLDLKSAKALLDRLA